ncbi:unnamed protein product [Adineta steineri]|uniref:Granulins domain-containing protein n=1 Tax=Adineta steineri TaxID=433720 RepID=A0A815EE67_9BILA|nr:unnamed protein product [Adineta steineri]CAF1578980.1 unnamed protein product [Adineta steineri]
MQFFVVILSIGIISQCINGCPNDLKFPLKSIPIQIGSVPCPDGQSSCPDGESCCLLSSGQYGCCPIPDAVCCSDHLHCCPTGYTCDVEHSRCQKGFEKSYSIVCPGGDMSCSDGETCCELQSGDFGCCPLPDAVCCSDHSHCCPHGYTCNIEQNKCDKGISIPWFTKKEAQPINKTLTKLSISTIQCPDEKSFCPEETTCCELTDGSYGCCPYLQASCCSDKMHCCGEGYSCDDSGSRCIRHLSSIINSIEIKSSLIPLTSTPQQTCPDGKTKCSSTSTCCPNKDNNNKNSYSCCAYSNGVCCGSDGSICCPYKYICDENHLTCQLNQTISIENKCGLTDLACPDNQTCCKISQSNSDQYACCTFPNGVCCDDGRHCCPQGTKCDNKSGGCIKH